jgi:hypothetical protein
MRTRWDPLEDDADTILRQLDDYRDAGVNHIVAELRQRTLDDYLRSIESLAALMERGGASLVPPGRSVSRSMPSGPKESDG